MPKKCEGPSWMGVESNHHVGEMEKSAEVGHDMVRRAAPAGEALVRCRNCSGRARRCVGPKLMNRCRPQKKAQKSLGKC